MGKEGGAGVERSLLNQEEEPPREQSRWGALEGDPSFSKKKKKKTPRSWVGWVLLLAQPAPCRAVREWDSAFSEA